MIGAALVIVAAVHALVQLRRAARAQGARAEKAAQAVAQPQAA